MAPPKSGTRSLTSRPTHSEGLVLDHRAGSFGAGGFRCFENRRFRHADRAFEHHLFPAEIGALDHPADGDDSETATRPR